jgi:hypothetical protein
VPHTLSNGRAGVRSGLQNTTGASTVAGFRAAGDGDGSIEVELLRLVFGFPFGECSKEFLTQ